MNTNLLNNYTEQIFSTRDNQLFESVLIEVNNIIDSAAYITNQLAEDKILHDIEDIKQDILLSLWLDMCQKRLVFNSEQEVIEYIYSLAQKTLL